MRKHFFFIIIFASFFFSACSQKAYRYPNYAIIQPTKTCKPSRRSIHSLLKSHLGKPYVWAEEGPDAFDCSGLTYNIYGSMGISIPRVAREQAKMGKTIPFSQLAYGDLIFFGNTNRRSRYINHVGIYLRDGWFAHASSKARKVTISHFSKEPKYLKRLKICKRYLSLDERAKYIYCDAPISRMRVTSMRHTTPWRVGMRLPRKAVPN